MKVCITAQDNNENAQVDPRFGRCAFFAFYDTDSGDYQFFQNEAAFADGGAGTKAGNFIAGKGVRVLMTGHLGPNAETVVNAAGIRLITVNSGAVKDVVDREKAGFK
ncbi:MAG: NifB/NifX family molybdenum-iron cluster-binding protein [Spirochaetia bacterium]|nr:NifB/NifX family molybdenum-iron cluster-binding protein [Spirochaetia bacterium]